MQSKRVLNYIMWSISKETGPAVDSNRDRSSEGEEQGRNFVILRALRPHDRAQGQLSRIQLFTFQIDTITS